MFRPTGASGSGTAGTAPTPGHGFMLLADGARRKPAQALSALNSPVASSRSMSRITMSEGS